MDFPTLPLEKAAHPSIDNRHRPWNNCSPAHCAKVEAVCAQLRVDNTVSWSFISSAWRHCNNHRNHAHALTASSPSNTPPPSRECRRTATPTLPSRPPKPAWQTPRSGRTTSPPKRSAAMPSRSTIARKVRIPENYDVSNKIFRWTLISWKSVGQRLAQLELEYPPRTCHDWWSWLVIAVFEKHFFSITRRRQRYENSTDVCPSWEE